MAPKDDAKKKANKAEAQRLAKQAERQRMAENEFANADDDDSGSIDQKELEKLLLKMLRSEGITIEEKVVTEFVSAEFAKADTDGSGEVDFEEFTGYYNDLADRLAGNAMGEAMDAAKKEMAKKLEAQAIAEDDGVYVALHTLCAVLSAESVKRYSGLVLPFKLREKNAESTPNPDHGTSTHGLILDLSRRAQRLITPWGSLPLGYRLSFEGYQDKVAPAEEDGAKKKAKKPAVPWPLVPAEKPEDPEAEKRPFVFIAARPPIKAPPGGTAPPPRVMKLRKLPMRCHYQVEELNGQTLPLGAVSQQMDGATAKKLGDRWKDLLKKNLKDPVPNPTLPLEDADGGPMINMLVGGTVAVQEHKLENLKKRKEVTQRTGNKKFPEEDLKIAMLITQNDDAAAAKLLVKMQALENTVLDRRGGHATRAQTRYALNTCEYDADHAEWMLKNKDKLLQKLVDKLYEQRGIAKDCIGLPTRQDLERRLVYSKAEEGQVLAELKREWKTDMEAMTEIIAAAEVEEMLTPERCEAFAFSRPLSAAEAAHAESLYLSDEFKKDGEAVIKFLSEAGTVLKRSATLGAPSREEVEQLLRELKGDSDTVLKFLQAWTTLLDLGPKQGQATREECRRYLTLCDMQLDPAKELMQTIWKIANPKAPKPPPKGSKKPPQPHYSEMCGFPSRSEAEWALLGTRDVKTEGKPLKIDKAVELLTKVNDLQQERTFPKCLREDHVWAFDPERQADFIKVRPLSHEEYKSGASPASVMLGGITTLIEEGETTGIKAQKSDMLASLTKFKYDTEKAKAWLNGVGTLMKQQLELQIVDREEVEKAMELHELDDAKVIELFKEAAELARRKLEIGNPTRDEIKTMLTLAWERGDDRVEVTAQCLTSYRALMSDDSQLMTLFGRSLEEEEKAYMRNTVLRYNGDLAKSLDYLKKVAEIESKGDTLGQPSRELIIATLDECGEDKRKAQQVIREDYHKRRDLELKEAYRKNKEKEAGATM